MKTKKMNTSIQILKQIFACTIQEWEVPPPSTWSINLKKIVLSNY